MSIIIKPVTSEKSINSTAGGKYIFKVNIKSNKHEILKAIEDLYKVKVLKVNIINSKAEEKLIRGKFKSQSKPWKKAIVSIKKGQKIEGFEIKE